MHSLDPDCARPRTYGPRLIANWTYIPPHKRAIDKLMPVLDKLSGDKRALFIVGFVAAVAAVLALL